MLPHTCDVHYCIQSCSTVPGIPSYNATGRSQTVQPANTCRRALRTLKSFHPLKRRLSFVVLLYLLQVLLCHSLLCSLRSPWRRRMRRRKEFDNRRMCKENIIGRSVQSICLPIGKMLLIKRDCTNISISKANKQWIAAQITSRRCLLSCLAEDPRLNRTAGWLADWLAKRRVAANSTGYDVTGEVARKSV